jgi:hypothetical protein
MLCHILPPAFFDEKFNVEDILNFAKTKSNFCTSVSNLLALTAPALCFPSTVPTKAAHRASRLR